MKLVKTLVRRSYKFAACLALLALLTINAHATGGAMDDATTMIGDATTLFGLVKVFVIAVIGFFMAVKIVKWARK